MPRFGPTRVDDGLYGLFEEAGRNTQRGSLLLRDMLAEFPERAGLARDLLLVEQEGDRITHDIIHRLNENGHGRPPLDYADAYELARTLDDIVDYAEQAGDQLGLYGVEATMEQAVQLADVLVAAAEQVSSALRDLRTGKDLSGHLVEIHRLENEGDRLARDGVASLFANGIDPMIVIRWKDIFESLEQAVDACESVAHLLEGISLKRSRG
ncbi:MAG: DUF47 family protein [Solirubrobacteraceae bacterium]